jgi:hypothetical protein
MESLLDPCVRPGDFQFVDHRGIAQAEMGDPRILGSVAVAGGYHAHLAEVTGARSENGADAVAVAFSSAQANPQPVAPVGNAIDEILSRGVVVVDDEVQAAVAVEVRNREPAPVAQAVQSVRRGRLHKRAIPHVDQ